METRLPEFGLLDSVAVFLVELLLGTIVDTGLIGSIATLSFNFPFFENFRIMLSGKDVPYTFSESAILSAGISIETTLSCQLQFCEKKYDISFNHNAFNEE